MSMASHRTASRTGGLSLIGCRSSNTRRWSPPACSPGEDRFEPIEGLLVAKMTKTPTPLRLDACFAAGARPPRPATKAGMREAEQPIRIPSRASEPEPDVALARGESATTNDNTQTPRTSPSSSRSPIPAWNKTESWRQPTGPAVSGLLDHQHPRPPARSLLVASKRRLLGPPDPARNRIR